MGIFDSNLRIIKRVFEHAWRDLAKAAAEDGHLFAPRAKLEIRMRLWVYPDTKRSSASGTWVYNTQLELDSEKPPRERVRGKTLWDRIMQPDEN